jgi:hypothetical protein
MNVLQATKIANRLEEAYKACRRLDSWEEKSSELSALILDRAEKKNMTIIEAVLDVANKCEDDPVSLMWIFAVAYELLKGDE